MKIVIAFSLALSLLSPPGASAASQIVLQPRDVLPTHGFLRAGHELTFPQNFTLDYQEERKLAAVVFKGQNSDGGKYACVMAISAETEVNFETRTRWTVASNGREEGMLKLVL